MLKSDVFLSELKTALEQRVDNGGGSDDAGDPIAISLPEIVAQVHQKQSLRTTDRSVADRTRYDYVSDVGSVHRFARMAPLIVDQRSSLLERVEKLRRISTQLRSDSSLPDFLQKFATSLASLSSTPSNDELESIGAMGIDTYITFESEGISAPSRGHAGRDIRQGGVFDDSVAYVRRLLTMAVTLTPLHEIQVTTLAHRDSLRDNVVDFLVALNLAILNCQWSIALQIARNGLRHAAVLRTLPPSGAVPIGAEHDRSLLHVLALSWNGAGSFDVFGEHNGESKRSQDARVLLLRMLLVDFGLSPLVCDAFGRSPLHIAAWMSANEFLHIIEDFMLCEMGVSVENVYSTFPFDVRRRVRVIGDKLAPPPIVPLAELPHASRLLLYRRGQSGGVAVRDFVASSIRFASAPDGLCGGVYNETDETCYIGVVAHALRVADDAFREDLRSFNADIARQLRLMDGGHTISGHVLRLVLRRKSELKITVRQRGPGVDARLLIAMLNCIMREKTDYVLGRLGAGVPIGDDTGLCVADSGKWLVRHLHSSVRVRVTANNERHWSTALANKPRTVFISLLADGRQIKNRDTKLSAELRLSSLDCVYELLYFASDIHDETGHTRGFVRRPDGTYAVYDDDVVRDGISSSSSDVNACRGISHLAVYRSKEIIVDDRDIDDNSSISSSVLSIHISNERREQLLRLVRDAQRSICTNVGSSGERSRDDALTICNTTNNGDDNEQGGVWSSRHLWPLEKRCLYVYFFPPEGVPLIEVDELFDSIMSLAREWCSYACIWFERTNDSSRSHIRVLVSSARARERQVSGFTRGVGTQMLHSQSWYNMLLSDKTIGIELFECTVRHEFGHAISLEHEHQHPRVPFALNDATIRGNPRNLARLDARECTFSKYDKSSVMHYRKSRSMLSPESSHMRSTFNASLSAGDKLAASIMYPFRLVIDSCAHVANDNSVISDVEDRKVCIDIVWHVHDVPPLFDGNVSFLFQFYRDAKIEQSSDVRELVPAFEFEWSFVDLHCLKTCVRQRTIMHFSRIQSFDEFIRYIGVIIFGMGNVNSERTEWRPLERTLFNKVGEVLQCSLKSSLRLALRDLHLYSTAEAAGLGPMRLRIAVKDTACATSLRTGPPPVLFSFDTTTSDRDIRRDSPFLPEIGEAVSAAYSKVAGTVSSLSSSVSTFATSAFRSVRTALTVPSRSAHPPARSSSSPDRRRPRPPTYPLPPSFLRMPRGNGESGLK